MAWTRRGLLGGLAGVAGGAAAGHLATRAGLARGPSLAGAGVVPAPLEAAGRLNDASLLEPTPVAMHTLVTQVEDEGLHMALRQELEIARAEGRPLALGAARHSMGGHALPRDGRALTFWGAHVEEAVAADPAAGTMRVHAGARWRDVIRALDPQGLSPLVMQSNNDFGVGATFSVNAHGWATAHGPMGATVREVTMMLADGRVVRASREENADLFAAAVGGYGLVGIVLWLDVEVARNALYAPTYARLDARDFAPAFAEAAARAPMAYGRLNVDRARFFEEAMLCTYAAEEGEVPPATGSGWLSRASRGVFRAQGGREWVKGGRWWLETGFQPSLAGAASRNTLLNEPVATLDDRDDARTDILHEYFVPPEAFPAFLAVGRRILRGSYQELLNVTLRWVERDDVSLLSYAPDGPRIAAVMLFTQEMTARAEADMARTTREMIDAVLDLGGSYYLPYRPHATVAQFRRAYPGWERLVDLKARVDPETVLRHGFWDRYVGAA